MDKKIRKSISGVTLVALVVTIIVLLILAGVAINLAIGNNGLFTRAKNAAEKWQEASDTEKGQLDEFEKLYDNTIKDLNIGNAGGGDGTGDGEGDDDKTKEELEKVIEELKSKQATGNAEVGDVLEGKTFSNSSGVGLTGTMTNRGGWSSSINPGGSVTIPAGYHNGTGKVNANVGSAGNVIAVAVFQATTGQTFYNCTLLYVNTKIATKSGNYVKMKTAGTCAMYGASSNDWSSRSNSYVYYQKNNGSRVAIAASSATYNFGYGGTTVAVSANDTLIFSGYSEERVNSNQGGIVFAFLQ